MASAGLSGGGTPILMYHSVGQHKIFFNVKPEEFKRQMDWIYKNGYKVISLKDLAMGSEGKLAPKTVVLTFDDSFEDLYFNVFPILKEYRFPATVFVATDFIGKEQKNESTGIIFKTLNWEQIKEMHGSGLIDFEPHSCSHRELAGLSLEDARREIVESKRIIEEGLQKQCLCFAYPRGKYSEAIIAALKESGFTAAVTVNPGRARKGNDLLELPRQSIDSATGRLQFLSKVK